MATKLGVTRERVRQIQKKATIKAAVLNNPEVTNWIVQNDLIDGHLIREKELLRYIDKDDLEVLKYLIHEIEIQKLYYSDSFDLLLWNISDSAKEAFKAIETVTQDEITQEDVKDWLTTLREEGILEVTEGLFHNHLIKMGYSKHNNNWTMRRMTIKEAAHLVVDELGEEVFRPSNPDDTSKMQRLVVEKGARLNKNVRAFWNAVLEYMVLCDRGAYCSPTMIKVESGLLNEVIDYIDKQIGEGIFYKTLFQVFKNRLLNESNIDNYHFLHGVLMYYYPDRYGYAKDYIYPLERERSNISSAEFLNEFLRKKGKPVTRDQILNKFKDLSDVQISYAQQQFPDILHWDELTYIHASALGFNDEDRYRIDELIKRDFNSLNGYSSAYRLYERLYNEANDIVDRYGIKNELNGFRVAEYLLRDKIAFSYPHILRDWELGKRFTTIDLITRIAEGNQVISRTALQKEAIKLVGKQIPSIGYAIRDFCFQMIRLDEDLYIRADEINNIKVIISGSE